MRGRKGNPPKVFKEFPSIINGSNRQIIRIRTLQYAHPTNGVTVPLLDIREFIRERELRDGRKWTGYSSNGLSLTVESCEKLYEALPTIISILKERGIVSGCESSGDANIYKETVRTKI